MTNVPLGGALNGQHAPNDLSQPLSGDWVDDVLLTGPDTDPCLRFGATTDRAALRALVADRQSRLADAGLAAGGTVALRMPPSREYVVTLLAAWRAGAQVALLDHRLAAPEIARALDRLGSQILVEATPSAAGLTGYADTEPAVTARAGGRPAETSHVLIQLSSGSTGPSKVIGRTAGDLAFELDRYERLPEFPRRGERIVLLSSMVHVLGLVGGLLQALHAGAELVLPERLTPAGILAAVNLGDPPARPTTVIGVPFYAELLANVSQPPATPSLRRVIVAGELLRPAVHQAFPARYGVPLGQMYGMTELGVIATDLTGRLFPAVEPTYGLELRVAEDELHISMPHSPYVGLNDPARWSDGWLHTRDAATVDPVTGHVVIRGRRDSQVSVGGLKVDLTEVEQTLCALPGVTEAVVVFDGSIRAYAVLADGTDADAVRGGLAGELAAYKLPRHLHVLPKLPRTTTGKLVRAVAILRAAAENADSATDVSAV